MEANDFLSQVRNYLDEQILAIEDRNPNELHRESEEVSEILDKVECFLKRHRETFESRLNEVLIHDAEILQELKQWSDWIGALNGRLKEMAYVSWDSSVDKRLQRIDRELEEWRIMGCANNYTHFSGMRAAHKVQSQKPTLRLVELEES